jgi:hypothetical protein
VGSDNDDDNLGVFSDDPVLLTVLCNEDVVSPEFLHGIIRHGHVHTTSSEAMSSSAPMAADPSMRHECMSRLFSRLVGLLESIGAWR